MMGSKKKISRVFGKSSGGSRCRRKAKHTGRRLYSVVKHKNRKNLSAGKLVVHIKRKLSPSHMKYATNALIYKSHLMGSDKSLKMKIKRIISNDPKPTGYRFMNLDSLQSHVSEITLHACLCPEAIELASKGSPPLKIETELRNLGLASILSVVCQGCRKQFKLENSPTLPGSKRYDINVRAVWGSIATGNGPSHFNEMMGTMNSPGLSPSSFSTIEEDIGKWWASTLKDSMLKAGAEERQISVDKGSFHQEVPAITVITDGGWSKRTHKHSYNALGGVAIIIGKETGKLLFLGVRNKYCYICNTSASNKTEPRPHTCYKNWDSDSLSMESDIILEGFKEAESSHGLRYMRIIGDGDSSVYARIKEEVPVWGRYMYVWQSIVNNKWYFPLKKYPGSWCLCLLRGQKL